MDAGRALGPVVSSYAIDDGERLLLFDPLAVPGEIQARASDREAVVVLTKREHDDVVLWFEDQRATLERALS